MDAAELLKTFRRFCKSKESCSECELISKGDKGCILDMDEYLEKAVRSVQIVEEWAKEHPAKTRQSEFLKMFPNAGFCQDVIDISPCSIEKEMRKCCGDRECDECKRTYWLTEVTDND